MAQALTWSPAISLPPSYSSIDHLPVVNYPSPADSFQGPEHEAFPAANHVVPAAAAAPAVVAPLRPQATGGAPQAQYLYYCVFHAGLPLQSREAFDASDDFIGRIPRIHIPQPRTFAALKRCIAHREGFEADAVASMYLEGNDEAVIDTDFMQLQEGSSGTTFNAPFGIVFDPAALRRPIPGQSQASTPPSPRPTATPVPAPPSSISPSNASHTTIDEWRQSIVAAGSPPMDHRSVSISSMIAQPASSQSTPELTRPHTPPSPARARAPQLPARLAVPRAPGPPPAPPAHQIRAPPAPPAPPARARAVPPPPPRRPAQAPAPPPPPPNPVPVADAPRHHGRDHHHRVRGAPPAWIERDDGVGEPTLSPTESGKVVSDRKPPGWLNAQVNAGYLLQPWRRSVKLRSGTVLKNGTEIYVDRSEWTRSRWAQDGEEKCRVIVKETRELSELDGWHYDILLSSDSSSNTK